MGIIDFLNFSNLPLLSLQIWLPFIGALCIGFGALVRLETVGLAIGRGAALLSLALLVPLLQAFDHTIVAMQFAEVHQWLPGINAQYALGVDGIGLILIVLTVLVSGLIIFSATQFEQKKCASYTAMFLLLQSFIVGVFATTDLLLFYLFWEAMLIPMFLAIGIWGSKRGAFAANKFFIITFVGSALLLVGVAYLGLKAGSFAYGDLAVLPLSLTEQTLLFAAFWLAFAVKVPMWPVHTWLPDAHTEAPTAGSVILAALMLKVGAYGFLRLAMPVLPDACRYFAWPMVVLSLIAIIYIGAVALVQKDMKRLIAYSSIAHMGFVTLGLFAIYLVSQSQLDQSSARLMVNGAVIQMISHGFSSGGLFLGFGYLYNRMHTRKIEDFGGITKVMPWFSFLYIVFAFANVGLPGTSGFVGEFMVIIGLVKINIYLAGLAGLTVILAACYTLDMVREGIFRTG